MGPIVLLMNLQGRPPYPWGEFQTHAFHVVPSMGPIVLVMNLQGRQKSL